MPILLALLFSPQANAQQLAFPSNAGHYGFWYPTAYYDHGSYTDWDCGGITYAGHRGTDLGGGSFSGMDDGRDVHVAATGVVVATNDGAFDRCTTGECYGGGGFGNYVYVAHSNGTETIYGHLKQGSVAVAVGDEVVCGDFLGQMGSSGYSTGPHLHFQVNDPSGTAVDPFDGACDPGPTHWVDQGVWDGLPSLDCDTAWPRCGDLGTLTCGDIITAQNDDYGSTDVHQYWGCSDFLYSGPEVGFQVVSSLNEDITVRLTGLTGDLDLFGLTDLTCDAMGCLNGSTNTALSDEEVVLSASANAPLAIVIDGWEGAVSGFDLEVICDGAVTEPTDTGNTGATGTTTTSNTTPTTTQTTDTQEFDSKAAAGCACQQSPPSNFLLWPGIFALAWRRRRA